MGRFDAEMVAYCLSGNRYHFVLGTRQANLSRLMRHINGAYTQRHNPSNLKFKNKDLTPSVRMTPSVRTTAVSKIKT